jgi:hypothetical protein
MVGGSTDVYMRCYNLGVHDMYHIIVDYHLWWEV